MSEKMIMLQIKTELFTFCFELDFSLIIPFLLPSCSAGLPKADFSSISLNLKR